jgi:Flp pilus assembly protein TadG
MIPKQPSTYARFIGSTRATAAIEFAAVLPVLLILFLASYDAANAITVYMKVRSATYTLAAITNQYGTGTNSQISTTTMTAITAATGAVLAPYSSTPTVVVISQIKATSNTQAKVSWSYSVNGTALTQGASFTLPTNLANNACGAGNYSSSSPCYFILASVSYTYTPTFGYFIKNAITLSDSLYMTPRVSQCVQYNNVPALSGGKCT